jgi:hypothetical protein
MKWQGSGLFLASILIVFGLSGCPNPGAPVQDGWLTVTLADASSARTLLPPIDMTVKSYQVAGLGPLGATFVKTVAATTASLTIKNLAAGAWAVTVNALNVAGTLIGQATGTATVLAGKSVTLALTVVPLAGTGTLDVTVNWTAGDLTEPSLLASVTSYSGVVIGLDFTVSGSQARCVSSATPTGFLTMSMQLLDHGIPVAGTMEVVRIVKDQTTTGVYTFTKVNKVDWTGTLQVNITPQLSDPIPVSISGVPAELTAGSTATASASVGDGTTAVVYAWYVNGISQSAGQAFTFGGGLEPGYYRLDVMVFTADGARAGTATASFHVIEAPLIGCRYSISYRTGKATS